jgi:hypothetical protein
MADGGGCGPMQKKKKKKIEALGVLATVTEYKR